LLSCSSVARLGMVYMAPTSSYPSEVFFVRAGKWGGAGSKAEGFPRKPLPVIREVIFGLRQIREKDFITVVQGDVVVLVFLDAGAELADDFVGPRGGVLLVFAGRIAVICMWRLWRALMWPGAS